MTQSEKAQLRYIALLTQNTSVQGDMGRTITSAANAIRVLKQQMAILGREIGNIFIPLLMKIIPVAIAVAKVLVKVARTIAKLFGFELPELNWDTVTNGSGTLAEDMDDAAGSAKEFRKQLQGFDELNVITSPSSGGSGADIGAGGFELDLPEYDMLQGFNRQLDDLEEKVKEFFGLIEDEAGNISYDFWQMNDMAKLAAGGIALFGGAKVVGALSALKAGIVGGTTSLLGFAKGLPIISEITAGISGVTAGTATLSGALGLAGTATLSFVTTLGAIGGVVSSIGSVIWATNHLNTGLDEATNAANIFGNTILGVFKTADKTISQATKDALEPFIEDLQKLGSTIFKLELGHIVTDEDVKEVKSQTAKLVNTLKTNLVNKTQKLADEINKLTGENRDKYLSTLEDSLNKEQERIDYYQERINEIVETASNERRNLTQQERLNITNIQKEMGKEGIKIMSSNEKESLTLLAKFNEKYEALTREQLYDTVAKAKELKDRTIEEATNEKTERYALAEEMRRTLPNFTQEMYEDMLEEANKAYDEEVQKANQSYDDLIKAAETKYPEVTKTINWETGKQLTVLQASRKQILEWAQGAIDGLKDMFNSWKENFKPIMEWWDNNVAPWFTLERWKSVVSSAIEGIKSIFNNWKDNFKPIKDWWNNNIAPWFTWEKWKNLAQGAIDGLKNMFNGWKNSFKPISDWWNNNIAPWFTWEKWWHLGEGAINGLKNIFSGADFHIKLPHFSWYTEPATGWVGDILSTLGLPASIPKLRIDWYASGGFPETGQLFMAREAGAELVGTIGNRTAVANNDQIVEGISAGVYNAMINANSENSNYIVVNVGNKKLYSGMTKGMRSENNRYGKTIVEV